MAKSNNPVKFKYLGQFFGCLSFIMITFIIVLLCNPITIPILAFIGAIAIIAAAGLVGFCIGTFIGEKIDENIEKTHKEKLKKETVEPVVTSTQKPAESKQIKNKYSYLMNKLGAFRARVRVIFTKPPQLRIN